MCLCVGMCTWLQCPGKTEEDNRSTKDILTCEYELLDLGSVNQTPILCKRIKCFLTSTYFHRINNIYTNHLFPLSQYFGADFFVLILKAILDTVFLLLSKFLFPTTFPHKENYMTMSPKYISIGRFVG